MSFDAVSIEYAFARLVGNPIGGRGTSHDADVFRSGKPTSLAEALSEAIDAIEERANSIDFAPEDSDPGGSKTRLEVAISHLRKTSEAMSQSKTAEPQDYHWAIIGCLISIITSLFEKNQTKA
jgi:hypothetical protein